MDWPGSDVIAGRANTNVPFPASGLATRVVHADKNGLVPATSKQFVPLRLDRMRLRVRRHREDHILGCATVRRPGSALLFDALPESRERVWGVIHSAHQIFEIVQAAL